MTTSQRQERQERLLARLEAEFRDALLPALRQCANGKWGLFGQNDGLEDYSKGLSKRMRSAEAHAPIELGDEIETLRARLGFAEPFPLYERFKQLRRLTGRNRLGEPKLATAWLRELGAS